MIFDGKGATPAQLGKKLAEVASSFGLTTHARGELCHAQAYAAACRDAAKNVKLQLCVRTCTHHKLATAMYLDIDASEGVDCAALKARLLEKLCGLLREALAHSAGRANGNVRELRRTVAQL